MSRAVSAVKGGQTLNEELFGKWQPLVGFDQNANPAIEKNIPGPNASSKAQISTNKLGIKGEIGAEADAFQFKGKDEKYDIGVNVGQAKIGAEAEVGPGGVAAKIEAGVNLVDVKGAGFSGKLGLSADTGFSIGPGGVKAEVLGTGFEFGKTMGISVGGSGVSWEPLKTYQAVSG